MKPFVLCFTGISGSGKTTLANAAAKKLEGSGLRLQVLDGDTLRSDLGHLFGYSRQERMKQNQVVKVISKYLLEQGVHVLISIVAPYDEMRKGMRGYFGDNYYQVYVKCPLEVCAERDVKGYYKLFEEKKLANLSGADEQYEVPEDAEVTVDTSQMPPDACVERIISFLKEQGYGV